MSYWAQQSRLQDGLDLQALVGPSATPLPCHLLGGVVLGSTVAPSSSLPSSRSSSSRWPLSDSFTTPPLRWCRIGHDSRTLKFASDLQALVGPSATPLPCHLLGGVVLGSTVAPSSSLPSSSSRWPLGGIRLLDPRPFVGPSATPLPRHLLGGVVLGTTVASSSSLPSFRPSTLRWPLGDSFTMPPLRRCRIGLNSRTLKLASVFSTLRPSFVPSDSFTMPPLRRCRIGLHQSHPRSGLPRHLCHATS